ncbi:MAG: hypothetical protein HY301_02155 [Verrucomicrobia bacterium]|nr:hypothetical protein [Verrucomicrobiota bacterium]
MKEWKVIVATLVIFGAGVVTGGILVHLTTPQKPPRAKAGNSGGSPVLNPKELRGVGTEQRREYLARLTRQLELTPEQSAKIDKTLHESQQHNKVIFDTIRPKLDDETHKVREQVRAVLNDDQRKKFDELNQPIPKRKETKSKETKAARKSGTNVPPADPSKPNE